jgi:pSer/pThr/pTyr-binding forkhead associated (FHA) protein
MSFTLHIKLYREGDFISEHEFSEEVVKIGRLTSSHIRLHDPKVARIHACIEPEPDGGYAIIDMGSTEGSFVNGQRVSKHRLTSNDEIRLGDSVLKVELIQSPEALPVDAIVESYVQPSSEDAAVLSSAPAPFAPSIDHEVNDILGGPTLGAVPATATTDTRTGEITLNPDSYISESAPNSTAALIEMAHGQSPNGMSWPPAGSQIGAWGSAPNNLASDAVKPEDRVLELKLIWSSTVLETLNFETQKRITMGDKAQTKGLGPFAKYLGCDIDVPAKTLPDRAFPVAEATGAPGTNYCINVHSSFGGRLERADGAVVPIAEVMSRGKPSGLPDVWSVPLLAEDTLYLQHGALTLQFRYIRRTKFIAPGFFETVNYAYLNILVLAFFLHALTIASFLATPKVTVELEEQLFKNRSRFIHSAFIKEKSQKAQESLLKDLNSGPKTAKAKGSEGKAGDKGSKNTEGKRAAEGKLSDQEVAKSVLDNILGFGKGASARRKIFGSGGLGGDLRAAMGNIRGRRVGDASGNTGLGARGKGPGGGGLSMASMGLGALGTAGFGGGGDGDYGDNATNLGKKEERAVVISQGTPVIRGSLDKELIRRVIKRHINQIRYCYERQLQATPGLNGKVRIEWVITAQGRVRNSKVVESTMADVKVERCMMRKIRTWIFPKPKGGGIVIVTYPWVLKPTG